MVAAASFQAAGAGLGDVGTARAGTVLAAAVVAGAGLEATACVCVGGERAEKIEKPCVRGRRDTAPYGRRGPSPPRPPPPPAWHAA